MPFDGLVEIAVGKDDGSVLAAEFERHRPNVGAQHFMIAAPVRDSPVKVMASTSGCDEELAGGVRAEAVNEVEDACGHADFVHHFREQRRGGRRFFEASRRPHCRRPAPARPST